MLFSLGSVFSCRKHCVIYLRHIAIPQKILLNLHYFTSRDNMTEKVVATLTWKIPWMEEPGRLQSMGSLRVVHD